MLDSILLRAHRISSRISGHRCVFCFGGWLSQQPNVECSGVCQHLFVGALRRMTTRSVDCRTIQERGGIINDPLSTDADIDDSVISAIQCFTNGRCLCTFQSPISLPFAKPSYCENDPLLFDARGMSGYSCPPSRSLLYYASRTESR